LDGGVLMVFMGSSDPISILNIENIIKNNYQVNDIYFNLEFQQMGSIVIYFLALP
jgi:hypothetical protein